MNRTQKYILTLIPLEIILIILYQLFTTYDASAKANSTLIEDNTIQRYYPFFQDVHVMIFVGFGFLMTFLKYYGFSAVGLTLFIGAFSIQFGILCVNFFHQLLENHWKKIELNIESLIIGDFAAGTVLITFGALLGRVSLFQLVLIMLFEIAFYSLNEAIGVIEYEAIDMGGSMYIHTFGAFFGLAVSYMLNQTNKMKKHDKNVSAKTGDMFAMIGTLFLWMFWPSFNGALANGNSQHRVVINTVFALIGSCLMAFIISYLLNEKLSIVHIQNATLAGGVAVGSSADLVIEPYGAFIIGSIAGMVSVLGYIYISPYLQRKIRLYDTCGVLNLHGIPGIIGGISGAISATDAGESSYGVHIGDIFPARADDGRTADEQGLYQFYAVLTTLGISIGGGLLTGFIIRCFNNPKQYYDDVEDWKHEIEQEYSTELV